MAQPGTNGGMDYDPLFLNESEQLLTERSSQVLGTHTQLVLARKTAPGRGAAEERHLFGAGGGKADAVRQLISIRLTRDLAVVSC